MGGRGSGGHNKKPAALRKAQGNAGHRPLNEREPVPPSGVAVMPIGLSQRAQHFWNELLPMLEEMQVMTAADAFALGELCMALDHRMAAEQLIQRLGIMLPQKAVVTEKDAKGRRIRVEKVIGLKINGAVRVASDADRRVKSYLAAFGLDPASRSKVVAEGSSPSAFKKPHGKPSDPLEDVRRAKTSSDIVQ